ncbi:hypothetical protein PsYK624_121290 [Phanerochaete sordida]|uniref:DUF6533 domain-containing protein n=1 Tax=Phanerochaete sordida TaxID=48140 RepID=A0A9P3LJ73_9APHY|nr:hypothetical protein PsYK624_121290 [Phanerochaete sordida]
MGALDASQINTVRHNRLSNYFDVIACTLMLYDYLLTFNGELTLIWPSSWSAIKILFLLTRYAPIIDITIVIWQLVKPDMSAHDCSFVYQSTGWLLLSGILIAEIILMLRTWAVFEQRRSVAIFLVVWTVVTWAPNMTSLGIFLKSLRYGPLPEQVQHTPGSGCHVTDGSPIVFLCWVLLMVFEAAILGMMIYKAWKNYRADRDSAVFRTVFRDGTVFYLYLFTLSTANVIVIVTASADLINLLSLPERMLHSILTARIILSLRRLGSKSELGLSTFSAGVRNAPAAAGGFGATIEFAHDPEDSLAAELSGLADLSDPSTTVDEAHGHGGARNSDSDATVGEISEEKRHSDSDMTV